MPNHVTTILTIEDAGGVNLAEIRKKFLNDKGQVDLDVILPSPACLKDFNPHGGVLSKAKAALGLLPDPKNINGDDFKALTDRMELLNAYRDASTKTSDDDVKSVIRAIRNYQECGYMYWYDWCTDNWGTKWNCYDQPDDGHPKDATSFQFQTAWAHPLEMVAKLSRKLPDVTFSVKYADEDLGANCGEYSIKGGTPFNEDIAPSWDAMSADEKKRRKGFAFNINYGEDAIPAEHGYDENWEYNDDLYEANN